MLMMIVRCDVFFATTATTTATMSMTMTFIDDGDESDDDSEMRCFFRMHFGPSSQIKVEKSSQTDVNTSSAPSRASIEKLSHRVNTSMADDRDRSRSRAAGPPRQFRAAGPQPFQPLRPQPYSARPHATRVGVGSAPQNSVSRTEFDYLMNRLDSAETRLASVEKFVWHQALKKETSKTATPFTPSHWRGTSRARAKASMNCAVSVTSSPVPP